MPLRNNVDYTHSGRRIKEKNQQHLKSESTEKEEEAEKRKRRKTKAEKRYNFVVVN